METAGLLLWTQEPITIPYSDPDESSQNPIKLFLKHKIHFNIILPYLPRTSEYSVSFRHSNQNFVHISHCPHVLYMPPLSHSP
jgi:hypothetical protein